MYVKWMDCTVQNNHITIFLALLIGSKHSVPKVLLGRISSEIFLRSLLTLLRIGALFCPANCQKRGKAASILGILPFGIDALYYIIL